MLRLVGAPSPAFAEPACVVTWALEPELAAYIERQLLARWPRLRVLRAAGASELALSSVDMCICGMPPPRSLTAPVLWLGDVDRGAGVGVVEVDAGLWKCKMPITGRHLVRIVDAIWRQTTR